MVRSKAHKKNRFKSDKLSYIGDVMRISFRIKSLTIIRDVAFVFVDVAERLIRNILRRKYLFLSAT